MWDSSRKILVVDESASALLMLSECLSAASYEVFTATSSVEAVGLLERIDISLLITDHLLPEMNGPQLTKLLRTSKKYQKLPIICLTATNDPGEIRDIYDSGVSTCLRKPVVFEELAACIHHLIRAHEREVALENTNRALQREVVEHQQTTEALHRALHQARQGMEVKSRFLANMSHELRTPLNGILGFTQLAIEQLPANSMRADLQMVKDASESMLHLINDLLSLSQLETGCLTLAQQPFDLHATYANVQKFFEIQCAAVGKMLVMERCPNLPRRVIGDELRLKQILMSLIANAVKFTTERGSIVVYLSPVTDTNGIATIQCSVSDNGVGIKPEEIPGLFQPFNQGDSSSTRERGGAGIGLAIARQLIRLMNGDIEAHSILDVGSSFRFTFELSVEATEQTSFSAESYETARLGASCPILVVEDNPVNQKLLINLLRKRGHQVLVANNGVEALETLESNYVSIVLMDCHMPVLDGYETTRRIRALQAQSKREVPVVAISASITRDEHERCIQAGMDAVVAKPLSSAALCAVIDQFTADVEHPSVEDSH